ncbi:hypothetical protein DL766_010421 [Monosporascus sp. MC13-8B]|uniref:Uncharacterized protein n=1 Tax=Monosporascus cannonballus TaxID=155416 RepID=A0ABY0HI04_9PEZI|nr:hypothetical protein DL763_005662 [Monosporascus cannonballus]RYO93883.1 hypothetical protein DL762_000838 [Monosporascus cannonballus]RYP02334.1 hypothetical protein DL766_010421 [Monosporascus sp. MC13-8B]
MRVSRLARNSTEAAAGGSAKGKEHASGEQSSGTADIDELRYTWYEKAKMTFWQAEALYMATRAQGRVGQGLEMAYKYKPPL